jgi:ribulose-bisphosphate carboxylase large chain
MSSVESIVFTSQYDPEEYIVARYNLRSRTTLKEAAWALAVGQSIGNPNMRSAWESPELFRKHGCLIPHDPDDLARRRKGEVKIAFPLANIDLPNDGISQLLCQLMGGQLDIDLIEGCGLLGLEIPKSACAGFLPPRYGLGGIRQATRCHDKPLLGGIIKPKVGISPSTLLAVVKELVAGGVNFIKEDEIMSNPACCSLKERVPLIMDYLHDKHVIYAVCVTADGPELLDRVALVHELGGNAVHLNIWSGLGAYRAVRRLDLPLALFFQKSGDRIMTTPTDRAYISWNVICKLAGLMGVDFIHAGMWGGYLSDPEDELSATLAVLRQADVLPALSCGLHPGLVQAIVKRFGNDWLANCGGSIHGHPGGTLAGARAMRQAIDGEHGAEYRQAIRLWGVTE